MAHFPPETVIGMLDFDGVLHRFFPLPGRPDEENVHFFFRGAFEAAVRQCPNLRLVVSSTWRNKYSMDELRGFFSPDIAERIIGATPRIGAGTGEGARQVEAEAWLAQNNIPNQPWIGIDDNLELYRPGAAVVHCHDEFGAREAALLVEAVANPVAYAQRYPVRANSAGSGIILPGQRFNPPA